MNDRFKHIDMKYERIMDIAKKGIVKLEYVPTDAMLPYILKTLPVSNHDHFVSHLDMEVQKYRKSVRGGVLLYLDTFKWTQISL